MKDFIPAWVDGDLTPVGKLEAHEKGLKHMAVSVFVMNENKVLIQQRAAGKYHTPNLWANTCCTHPEWDEDSADCAVRRLREELGISRLEPVFCDTVEYRADVGGGLIEHEVVDIFLAEAPRDLSMSLNPDEVQAVSWIDLDELALATERTPEKFTPWIRIYLAEFRDRIFTQRVSA